MNAAAKALSAGSLFEGGYRREWVSRPIIALVSLFILVLISALMVIYTKEIERRFISETQLLQTKYTKAKIRQTQLLLEKSTWMSPARLEKQAANTFDMRYPAQKKVIVLRR